MSRKQKLILVSHDAGLIAHWQRAFPSGSPLVADSFRGLEMLKPSHEHMVWLDLSLPDLPAWADEQWSGLIHEQMARVVAASSSPKDAQAIEALDAGCAGYCHAFSDAKTLAQVKEVVQAGHVWIGKTLMHRLIDSANKAATLVPVPGVDWAKGLTQRECEVAVLAANGASNHQIALDCKISERTVKAHLSATFDKLNVTDRLQLALRVHGIH